MEPMSRNAAAMNHPNQSSIPEHGYMKEHTPNHNSGPYPHAIPVNNYDGNMNRNENRYGCGTQYPYDNETQGSRPRSSAYKMADLGCLALLGLTSLMGFCFAADFSAANDGGSSKLILSFITHLLVTLFIVILGLEILCNKGHIVSVGGRIVISLILFLLSLVAGALLLADDLLDAFCDDGWSHNKRNCNTFKASGVLNILCAFFFLVYLILQCVFQPFASAVANFVKPNNHTCALFRSKYTPHTHSDASTDQQIQSPVHPSTQV